MMDNKTMFHSTIEDELEKTYYSRQKAVDAATYLESYYEGGISIEPSEDSGWKLSQYGAGTVATLPYDADGNEVTEWLELDPDPDGYVLCNVMDCDHWDDLEPVRDFLKGRIDELNVFSVMPVGLMDTDDGDTTTADASEWVILCADK